MTAQVGAAWSENFTTLELQHDLNINNLHHIWLLHYLSLSSINQQLHFFAEAWNQHRIQIHDGPNCSPADLFGFDMMVHGICGDQLPEEVMSDEDLEVYGVDWKGLHDEQLLHSQRQNNSIHEGSTSWIGHTGPPQNLNEVSVYAPLSDALTSDELVGLAETIHPWYGLPENRLSVWSYGLGYARGVRGDVF